MNSMAASAVALLLQASASPTAPDPGAWIVTCAMGALDRAASGPAADAPRVFRLGPQLFQEWNPATQAFGPNLCLSFSCSSDANRLEGVISSNTLVLTISLDRQAGQANWRTQGASNLRRSSGTCAMKPDVAPAKPGA